MSQDSSRKSSLGGPPDPPKQMPSFYTKRHEHIETEEGHMVITGLTGAETMQKCEDEPIHIPGAVQSFGCLVALKELEDGTSLDVRVASEVWMAAVFELLGMILTVVEYTRHSGILAMRAFRARELLLYFV